jgi:hypothetical protein
MKKVYGKPRVARVALKPEEAVLTACKTNASPGPQLNPCSNPGGAACMQNPSS